MRVYKELSNLDLPRESIRRLSGGSGGPVLGPPGATDAAAGGCGALTGPAMWWRWSRSLRGPAIGSGGCGGQRASNLLVLAAFLPARNGRCEAGVRCRDTRAPQGGRFRGPSGVVASGLMSGPIESGATGRSFASPRGAGRDRAVGNGARRADRTGSRPLGTPSGPDVTGIVMPGSRPVLGVQMAPRPLSRVEPAAAHEASGRAAPGHDAAGILPLPPTPQFFARGISTV